MDWKCRDGRVIPVKQMSTSHLRNTVRMMRREGVATEQEFLSLCAYLGSNPPDGAEIAASAALDSIVAVDTSGVLAEMEEELRRRLCE